MFQTEMLNQNVLKNLSEDMKKYFGAFYCTMVSSGTEAIVVALKALKLPRGSKVIIPDISFIATATAVASVGLIPVYADCTKEVWGMPVKEVERLYHQYDGVKACIAVHFSGIVNRDIKKIADFCKRENIYLIEDCAQVFGARYLETRCGMFGDVGAFSFQTSKVITCGEGGMVLSKAPEIAERIQAVSDWGLDYHENRILSLPCGNSRMNPLAALFLREQLKNCNSILKKRRKDYKAFCNMAKKLGLKIQFEAEEEPFQDMPFFLLLKKNNREHPVNVLHPVNEYPMHLSRLVISIIETQYPDLLQEYKSIIAEQNYSESIKMVNDTEFVPMYGIVQDNMEERLRTLLVE